MTFRTIGLVSATLLLGTPVLAQSMKTTDDPRYTTREVTRRNDALAIEALRDDYAAVARRDVVATKLSAGDYQNLARQRSELNRLIDRIEAGHRVGAGDVDRALGIDYID